MGYFGRGAFENDKGLDWLESAKPKTLVDGIRAALSAYLKYRKKPSPALSARQMRAEIDMFMEILQSTSMPAHQKKRHGTRAAWLEAARKEEEEYYQSGAYRFDSVPPVEEALAAAELASCWNGHPPAGLTERAAKKIAMLSDRAPQDRVPGALVVRARQVVERALASKEYKKMRAFYLNASPEISGGDDKMAYRRDLKKRLARS